MSNSINTTQISTPRKRKQLMNDSNSFVTPPIPAKRTTPLTMFFPKVTPSDGSIVIIDQNSKSTQTDSSISISKCSTQHLDLEQQQLTAEIEELNRTKFDIQRQNESIIETIKRCSTITRSLLIEKSQLEKKQAREKAMENRLRLGQFVTQRQGTSFVEQWIDGYDFLDKQRAQEQLTRAKESLDRERKTLTKKKTFLLQQQQIFLPISTDDTFTLNYSQDSNQLTTKSKRTSRISAIKTSNRYECSFSIKLN